MNESSADVLRAWNEENYRKNGWDAQRNYPNEELVRYLARQFSSLAPGARAEIDVLELGSGLCGNLWMVAREGFRAHGVDISESAVRMGAAALEKWGQRADLRVGLMTRLPFDDSSMDVVFDILSASAMTMADFDLCLAEVSRVLRPGGRLFLYTPGSGSDAFKNFAPATKLDEWTLSGIHRKDSPYYGCFYPQRFDDVPSLSNALTRRRFTVAAAERSTRTYGERRETFEYLCLEARKAL